MFFQSATRTVSGDQDEGRRALERPAHVCGVGVGGRTASLGAWQFGHAVGTTSDEELRDAVVGESGRDRLPSAPVTPVTATVA
ncbi:hypothetical protein [Streptomyces mirabilis]|uniref:hypothetical protein n=1 Tax=Streptomyces mirabilis TaxID=68239 RepID=UPI00332FC9A6